MCRFRLAFVALLTLAAPAPAQMSRFGPPESAPAQTGSGQLPSLQPYFLKVGEVGLTDRLHPEVLQVLSETTMLIMVPSMNRDSQPVKDILYVKGVPTKGLVDGKECQLPPVLQVVGTYRYATSGGSSKTVFALGPEPEDARKRREAANRAEAELKRETAAREELKLRETERRAAAESAARKAAAEAKRKAEAPDRAEKAARASLELTKELIREGKTDLIIVRLKRLIREYPDTAAAKEAKKLLYGR